VEHGYLNFRRRRVTRSLFEGRRSYTRERLSDACDLTIVPTLQGDSVDCGIGAMPPTNVFTTSVYDRFTVLIGADPSFSRRITSVNLAPRCGPYLQGSGGRFAQCEFFNSSSPSAGAMMVFLPVR